LVACFGIDVCDFVDAFCDSSSVLAKAGLGDPEPSLQMRTIGKSAERFSHKICNLAASGISF